MAKQRNNKKIALLAIHPKYAESIFRGVKKVEFRRRRFKGSISHIVVYSTKPIQKIVGYFNVARIEEAEPDELWEKYNNIGGIEKQEFTEYFKYCETGIAIRIGSVSKLEEPLNLIQIDKGIKPPQNFIYLSEDKFRRIRHCS
jgi:predicted transcriptional regulator